jgi:D-inositol-3-phosphate glycosyltransferase
VVAPQMNALVDDLARRRAAAGEPATRHRIHPVKGDPFRDFAGFATHVLGPQTPLSAVAGATADQVRAAGGLDVVFPSWRAELGESARAFELIAGGQARTVGDVLQAFPAERARAVELGLLWLAKHGFIDWPT